MNEATGPNIGLATDNLVLLIDTKQSTISSICLIGFMLAFPQPQEWECFPWFGNFSTDVKHLSALLLEPNTTLTIIGKEVLETKMVTLFNCRILS